MQPPTAALPPTRRARANSPSAAVSRRCMAACARPLASKSPASSSSVASRFATSPSNPSRRCTCRPGCEDVLCCTLAPHLSSSLPLHSNQAGVRGMCTQEQSCVRNMTIVNGGFSWTPCLPLPPPPPPGCAPADHIVSCCKVAASTDQQPGSLTPARG